MVARSVSTLPFYIRQMKQFLRPIIEERLAKIEELGETWDEAPVCPAGLLSISSFVIHTKGLQNDMIMWLINEAKGVEKSLDGLARRMLMINFASIQTTAYVSTPPTHLFLSLVALHS